MESFVLTFQISSWVEDTFHMSLLENVLNNRQKDPFNPNIFLVSDLAKCWGSFYRHYIEQNPNFINIIQTNDINKIKHEFLNLKKSIIDAGFQEIYENIDPKTYNKTWNLSVVRNLGESEINFKKRVLSFKESRENALKLSDTNKMILFNYSGTTIPFVQNADKYYQPSYKPTTKPKNSYKRWNEIEETQLLNELVFNNYSVNELANLHERTFLGIVQRIPKLIPKLKLMCKETFSVNNKETQTDDIIPNNLENESNNWTLSEKQQLFDEYMQFLRKTSHIHGRSSQSIYLMLGEPPNLMKFI